MFTMTISLIIDDALGERIQRIANQRGRSPHSIMLEAIQQCVEREEARESFLQGALESWAEYKETGLHLNEQELFAWLDTWGTAHESEAPKCHK
jgi:predicted transcriptional regulator